MSEAGVTLLEDVERCRYVFVSHPSSARHGPAALPRRRLDRECQAWPIIIMPGFNMAWRSALAPRVPVLYYRHAAVLRGGATSRSCSPDNARGVILPFEESLLRSTASTPPSWASLPPVQFDSRPRSARWLVVPETHRCSRFSLRRH